MRKQNSPSWSGVSLARTFAAAAAALLFSPESRPAAAASAGSDGSCQLSIAAGDDLQQAIDRAAGMPHPVTVCLGPGLFRLQHFLSINSDDLHIRGQGQATRLELQQGLDSPVIVIGDYEDPSPSRMATNISLEHLQVIGGGASPHEFEPDHPYMMNSVVVVRAGTRVVLRDLDVDRCRSACLLTERGSRDILIEGNSGRHSLFDGLSLNDSSFIRVIDNHFSDNHAAGITAENLEDSTITGNTLSDNGSEGIYLSNSRRNQVSTNTISYNAFSGVFLTCAVIQLSDPISCRAHTMSADNSFEVNQFSHNRYAYYFAPNRAASCADMGIPNRSRNDAFVNDPNGGNGSRCISYLQERQIGS